MVHSSAFSISRTAHRNNASNYFINDRKSNFTEVGASDWRGTCAVEGREPEQGRGARRGAMQQRERAPSFMPWLPTEGPLLSPCPAPALPPPAQVTELLKGKGVDLDNNRFLILQVRPQRGGGCKGRRLRGLLGVVRHGQRAVCAATRAQARVLCCRQSSAPDAWRRQGGEVPVDAGFSACLLACPPAWLPLPAVQGEVEQISMMKPKGQTEHETGLLEYLEDIIGTDKYIPLLEETAKR